MTATMTRTGRHTHMRPVVRPLPRPQAVAGAALTW
jgi:hypothetical protein